MKWYGWVILVLVVIIAVETYFLRDSYRSRSIEKERMMKEAAEARLSTWEAIHQRDSIRASADQQLEELTRRLTSRRPTNERVDERFEVLEGAAVDSLFGILDRDLPPIR